MALGKVRAVHPDLFWDDEIAEASIPARYLFIGLWCFACDNGHLQNRSKQIKRWLYPTDDVNVAELLRELIATGVLLGDADWLTIRSLAKRQRIDIRYFKTCSKPGCEKPKHNPERETRRVNVPRATKPATDGDGDGDGVSDGEGEGEKEQAARKRPATRLPQTWKPTTEHLQRALEGNLDLGRETDRFRAHADEKDRRAANWNAAFTRWLMNAAQWSQPRTEPKPNRPTYLNSEPPSGLTDDEYRAWYAQQVAASKGTP